MIARYFISNETDKYDNKLHLKFVLKIHLIIIATSKINVKKWIVEIMLALYSGCYRCIMLYKNKCGKYKLLYGVLLSS